MSGTKQGGLKLKETIKSKYGLDFWQRIGKMGGSKSGEQYKAGGDAAKGFADNIERAREAGRKGGLKSKRTKKTK